MASWLHKFLSHQGPIGRSLNEQANTVTVKKLELDLIEGAVHRVVTSSVVTAVEKAAGAVAPHIPSEAEIDALLAKELGL